MALVHEELYGSDDLSSVGMGEYVPRLVERVVASADVAVQVEFAVEDMRLPVTRSIPCGLVLNELVMNAVKHAFRHGREGRLRVTLARCDGQVELAVEDNGPGLPQDFDLESPATLGLTLITSLARQLFGSVAAQGLETGARFALRFPVEEQP
jgi:two-component sensor histidine kinase